MSHVPSAGVSYGSDFKKDRSEKEWTSVGYFQVDEDYLKNMGLTLKAGKFFSKEAGESNKNFIVINEAALDQFQLGNAIDALGKTIISMEDSTEKQVIGVVKNYHHELFGERLEPFG